MYCVFVISKALNPGILIKDKTWKSIKKIKTSLLLNDNSTNHS